MLKKLYSFLKVALRLSLKCFQALPRVVTGSLKGAALLLGTTYLFLIVLNAISSLPGPGISSIQIVPGLKPLVPSTVYQYERSVVRLSVNGQFMCTGVVIGNNYVLTASHCVVDENGVMKDERVTVESDDGRVMVIGRTAGVNTRMDWAIIQGNFERIPGAHVISRDLEVPPMVLACGYPQGSHYIYCETLKPITNDAFLIKCGGVLQPGMSGGPVFDDKGNVVGLNIRVYYQEDHSGSGYSPTIGILANFGIAD